MNNSPDLNVSSPCKKAWFTSDNLPALNSVCTCHQNGSSHLCCFVSLTNAFMCSQSNLRPWQTCGFPANDLGQIDTGNVNKLVACTGCNCAKSPKNTMLIPPHTRGNNVNKSIYQVFGTCIGSFPRTWTQYIINDRHFGYGTNEPLNAWMNDCANEWMCEWINRGWMNELLKKWVHLTEQA